MEIANYILIALGSLLMVFNIIGFVRFAKTVREQTGMNRENKILYIPILLLTLFLAGYIGVGIFQEPDLLVAGILFGGSVFVFIIYLLLERITRRIIEQEHLEAKLEAAQESDRAKTVFLSVISHEMRTPLNVILGLNTLSLTDGALSRETRTRIEKTNQSAEQMLGLVNNILDLNGIETGEFIAKPELFSLSESLDQICAIIRTNCEKKGLVFTSNVDESARGSYVGDDMRLRQVLLNILDNAVKFTRAPGRVELGVSASPGKDTQAILKFTVKDNGQGIDPQFIPKLFDLFAKEDCSSTTSHGGSGLGLAVSKRIVERLGGKIEVESVKGTGSLFTVTVPMERADSQDKTENESGITLENKRILIAEDIPENAEIVADLLELEGALSEHAENGSLALDMFSASPPGYYDAILMDLRMPVMDGITAARKIRALNREDAAKIPIIALTANAFESDVKQSLDAGMNAHLSKPADSEKLFATLRKYIAEFRGGI